MNEEIDWKQVAKGAVETAMEQQAQLRQMFNLVIEISSKLPAHERGIILAMAQDRFDAATEQAAQKFARLFPTPPARHPDAPPPV